MIPQPTTTDRAIAGYRRTNEEEEAAATMVPPLYCCLGNTLVPCVWWPTNLRCDSIT